MPLPLASSSRLVPAFRAASFIHRTIVEARLDLFKKYGVLDEGTGERSILPENKDKFAKEYTILMEAELEWELPRLNITDFGVNVSLSIREVATIDWFLDVA
jgi:hypothetical protein